MTSASRVAQWMRRRGWMVAVVENHYGKFRSDAFGIGDVLACHPARGIWLIQAYRVGQGKKDLHDDMRRGHPAVDTWMAAGGKFAHGTVRHYRLHGRNRYEITVEQVP